MSPMSKDERRRKSNRDAQRAFRERQREAQQQQSEENEALRQRLAATESELEKLKAAPPTLPAEPAQQDLSGLEDHGVTDWSPPPLETFQGMEYEADANHAVTTQLSFLEQSPGAEADSRNTAPQDLQASSMSALDVIPFDDTCMPSAMSDTNALGQLRLPASTFPAIIPQPTSWDQNVLLHAINALQSSESHALKTAKWFEEATRIAQQQSQAWFRFSQCCTDSSRSDGLDFLSEPCIDTSFPH